MFMFHFIRKSLKTAKHHPRLGGLEILKYIGPGLLVTVGFIDPGNWASNLAAGADYGYTLLWIPTLFPPLTVPLRFYPTVLHRPEQPPCFTSCWHFLTAWQGF